eukprot:GFUD01040790.1.p1 GENE.GFUD01040790.1~~GFUD01040790.1.p1  ORF type:complete len:387 (-),score=70.30 GFUD01040790.1:134-1294(-)
MYTPGYRQWLAHLAYVSLQISVISGHGRLMNPPSRNSMWRFGFINPINYNDNEVFCGGFSKQFEFNDGKCGICGDSYDEPSPQHHETGGNYGNGVITKTYVVGSVVDIEVEVTANHKGRFELKVCPVRAGRREATQDCLDQHPLSQLDDSPEFPIYETPHSLQLQRKAKLPAGLVCSRCVLQWTWVSANSWGDCKNGTLALGCGPQETFRNCADIRIVSSATFLPATDNPRAIMIRDINSKTGRTPLVVRSQICIATQAYRAFHGMSDWCQQNCLAYPPNCPNTICTCLGSCAALPDQTQLTDFECSKRCLRYPHQEQCPEQCSCSSQAGQDFSAMDAVIIDAREVSNPSVSDYLVKTRPLTYHIPIVRPVLPWRHIFGMPYQYLP